MSSRNHNCTYINKNKNSTNTTMLPKKQQFQVNTASLRQVLGVAIIKKVSIGNDSCTILDFLITNLSIVPTTKQKLKKNQTYE